MGTCFMFLDLNHWVFGEQRIVIFLSIMVGVM